MSPVRPVICALSLCIAAAGLGCESTVPEPLAPPMADDAGKSAAAPAEGEAVDASETEQSAPRRRAAHVESRRAPETDKERYGWELIEGDAAYYSADFDKARAHYLEAMALRPDKMAPALGALRTMVVRGRGEERANIVKRIQARIDVLAARQDSLGASHLLAARLAIALQQPGESLDRALLAVEHLGAMGVSWRVLGEAAMVAEQWGTAWDALKRAADLGLAAKAGTWERMADVLDEMGELAGAEAAARKAVEMTGSDPHARRKRLNMLAAILKHRGELEGAEATVQEALEYGPDDPAVLHNAATISDARGEPELALKLYDAALAAHLVPMTSWRRGHLLLRLDRRNDAVEAFTAAAAHIEEWTWPRSTRWWPAYDVGRLYARAGYEKKAIGWFEDSMRLARTGDAIRDIRSWLSYSQVKAGAKAKSKKQPEPLPSPRDPPAADPPHTDDGSRAPERVDDKEPDLP